MGGGRGWGGKGAGRADPGKLLGREGSPRGAPRRPPGSTHRSPSSSWAGCGRLTAGSALGPWVLWGKRGVGGSDHGWGPQGGGPKQFGRYGQACPHSGLLSKGGRRSNKEGGSAPSGHPVLFLPQHGKARVRTGGGRNASQDRRGSSSPPKPHPNALRDDRVKASVAARGLCCSCPALP